MTASASRAILVKLRGNVLTASDVTNSAMNVSAFVIAHCLTIVSNTGQAHSSSLLGSARRMW